MHPEIKNIFERHEKWLKEQGGNQAIKTVQDANLILNITMSLNAVDMAAYKRGYNDAKIGVAERGLDSSATGDPKRETGVGHSIRLPDDVPVPSDK